MGFSYRLWKHACGSFDCCLCVGASFDFSLAISLAESVFVRNWPDLFTFGLLSRLDFNSPSNAFLDLENVVTKVVLI